MFGKSGFSIKINACFKLHIRCSRLLLTSKNSSNTCFTDLSFKSETDPS